MKTKRTVKARILSNKQVAPDHFAMELEQPFLAENSRPGQFVTCKVRELGTDPLLRIPLGVHRIKKKGIDLLYKVVGTATSVLSRRVSGEELDLVGPLGNGFDLEAFRCGDYTRAVLVAGGHGIAPLFALAEELLSGGSRVEVFFGTCISEHVICTEELEKMGIKVHIATEDGMCGHKGYVTEPVRGHIEKGDIDPARSMIFACGPRPLLAELERQIAGCGIPAQVSLDAYMACGIGACLGCAVRTRSGYKLVCKDGPVFISGEIDWEAESKK
ncbi:MAG: dihydroorotate dehydrogenase electron transfer subunit [Candidatus Omnitrophica bacterium]|nr:dihydroorotate dehydrogenase electron transfer subunit [Candidatus Omnitrophota bacterium]